MHFLGLNNTPILKSNCHIILPLPSETGSLHLSRISLARPFLLAAAANTAQRVLLSEWFVLGHARRRLGIFLKCIVWRHSATESRSSEKCYRICRGFLCPNIVIPSLQDHCCQPGLEFTGCSGERSHPMNCIYICTFFSYMPSTQPPRWDPRGLGAIYWRSLDRTSLLSASQVLGCCQGLPRAGGERCS